MLKYTAKLTHYAFDNTYTNARLFETKTERDTYFDNLAGYTQAELVNFNARDILSTETIIKVEPNAPLFDLLNYNYCVITQTENDAVVAKLYFWIKRSVQESGGQIRVYLENDILQNYWYDVEFSECMINRAHLDRLEASTGNIVKFRGNADSNLFEREDIKDVAKRLVSRQRLMLHQDLTDNSPLNQWLYDNVIAWCYLSVSQGKYKTGIGNTEDDTAYVGVKTQSELNQQINYANSLFCFPIFKGSAEIQIRDNSNNTHLLSAGALPYFLGYNNGYANVFSIKLSIKPPFDLKNWSASEYTISGNSLTINTNNTFGANFTMSVGNHQSYWQFGLAGFLNIEYDDPTPIKATMIDTSVLPQIEFNKNDIIGADKNIIFNPKMNNADYKNLRISFAGSAYEYDLQKLNTQNPTFEYYEMLTSDITKALLQFAPTDNAGVFNQAYGESYNGLAFTNDLSLPFAKGQDDVFWANNKNAYLSFQNNQQAALMSSGINAVGGLLGGAAAIAMSGGLSAPLKAIGGALGGAESSAVSGFTGLLSTLIRQKYERANFDLSIDNMRSAPETLANINGNAILTGAIAPLGIYIEIYSALENELKIANDIAYDNGYTYNRYGQVKDFVNTRKYFNYIQASVENIIGNISNEVKLLLRQILANGIKLWHTDNIQFDKENYEKWLEN